MIEILLPYPPTANTYWRRAGTHIHLSARGAKYIQAVQGRVLRAGRPKALGGECVVDIFSWPPDNRVRDIDNIQKPLLDSLVKAGVLADDRFVARLTTTRGPKVQDGAVLVRIWAFVPSLYPMPHIGLLIREAHR